MAVHAHRALIGLMWDPMPEGSTSFTKPGALFSVPNTFEDRDDSLMALSAFSAPEVLDENSLIAREAVDHSGAVVESFLVMRPADSSAEIVLDWIEHFGLPEPAETPRSDFMDAYRFSLGGYANVLWQPEENAWLNGYGPPVGTGAFWPFMRDQTVAGRLLPDDVLGSTIREHARLARGDTRGNFGLEVAVCDGGLIELMGRRLRASAKQTMAKQNEAGGWGYEPKPVTPGGPHDGLSLGEPGAVELGTCARNAHSLLVFAHVAQDAEALAAGLLALERMGQFDVPRAAQVWEIPVHSPDVLAASQAVRANLAGFRATGDEQWRVEAVRWAKLGLPFIYLWDSGEYPYMRYGSIPVFGATWWTGAWFGRPVQWCGSDYADALLELSAYDDSLDWRGIAEGLAASAANQQAQDGPTRGLYTDATNLMDGSWSDYWVAPYHYCSTLLRLMDVPFGPTTATVDAGGRVLAITAAGTPGDVSFDEASGKLEFSRTFPDSGRHYILLANCPEAASVAVDGQPLPRVDAVLDAMEASWQYDSAAEMLEIRIETGATASVTVAVE